MEQSKNENNNSMKEIDKPLYKKPMLYIGLAIILAVIVFGVNWYKNTLNFVTTDDAYIDSDRLELGSKILGRIVKLNFEEGDSVIAGQLVAELDSTDIIARLSQTKISLENAKLNIALAQVNLQKAELDLNRAKTQLQNKVIPQSEYDNAQNKYLAAQAELKISQSKISAFESEIKVIETQLENTKIYSSIDGVIAKKWTLDGAVIQPGQPIYSIYQSNDFWVTAQLEETKISSLNIGDSVEIDVDAYPDIKFTGNILKIGTNTAAQFSLIPPSNASGNFTKVTQRIPVKISIGNNSSTQLKYGLLPGMSVEVKIRIARNG